MMVNMKWSQLHSAMDNQLTFSLKKVKKVIVEHFTLPETVNDKWNFKKVGGGYF